MPQRDVDTLNSFLTPYQLTHIKWNEQEKIPILIDENLLKTSLLRDLFLTLAWFILFRPGESRFDMTRTPVKGISAQRYVC
jgi:hypothetical protein